MTESNRGRFFEWLAGIASTVIAGVLIAWLTGVISEPPYVGGSNDKKGREHRLILPIPAGDPRHAADLDGARMVPLSTSATTSDADLIARQTIHGIVMEPGVSKNGTNTFEARFTRISDNKVGREGCKDASVAPHVSNHLQLESDRRAGSHVCMVTTQGRLAELEIMKVDLSPTRREVEIKTVVWAKD